MVGPNRRYRSATFGLGGGAVPLRRITREGFAKLAPRHTATDIAPIAGFGSRECAIRVTQSAQGRARSAAFSEPTTLPSLAGSSSSPRIAFVSLPNAEVFYSEL